MGTGQENQGIRRKRKPTCGHYAKADIVKSNTELWRGRDGSLDNIFTYSMEWAYAKQVFIRVFTADVLWEKIELGQYDEATALEIARALFYGTAAGLFGIS